MLTITARVAALGDGLSPATLRNKMILLAIFMVFLPTLLMASLVEVKGRDALLTEKKAKLYAVAHLLDQALGDQFSRYQDLPRAERIAMLNQRLAQVTERITDAFPNVAAGYYHRQLDAIITYAPQRLYGHTVGMTISAEHPGRQVMSTGEPQVKSGSQVRGDIMNAMIPIKRDGAVIGYIWANELTNDIDKQTFAMDFGIFSVIGIGLAGSLLLIITFSRRLTRDVETIKERLNALPFDLNAQIPPLRGEMGEIAENINHLSHALREARTLNELIVESAADGMISVDTDGRIAMCNPAACAITGYRRDQLLGQHYKSLFEKNGYHSPVLDTLMRGIEHIGVEVSFPAREQILQIKASSSQLRNTCGEIIGALVVFTDLTAQKEMQRHIAQAERLATLGELMAGVAHEVRNPLTSISGFVQYLKEGETAPQRIEYIDIIMQEVRSINRVIQQLLEFSRPHSSKPQNVSVNQIIRETLVLVHTNALNSRIDFHIMLDDTLPDIEADAALLKQAVLNLMINAVQAIPARGDITVLTGLHAANKLKIQIVDTGIGMDAETQKKAFTPFFTTKPTGTGLGLAIAQRIVAEYAGDIVIASEPQRGTTVTLVIPMKLTGEIRL